MPEQWKMICRLKDMPVAGPRMVQRGLAWQDLPGVALFRAADDTVYALLDTVPGLGGPLAHGVLREKNLIGPKNSWIIELDAGRLVAPVQAMARMYAVRLLDGRIYLDLKELNVPASKAEQALAGSFALLPHVQMA
ncbi:nitrite reductase (NAD(P)H) small subunit [Janthinobacterium psychrotolerans]|uniref:Nitrite reductase (NADH) small subunit n=1 Tax=Janthinobacterium psychrotolerans TaxID=1747903 RepID=A0A1A7BXY4_9BURK|nr:nitrite reductase (NAD(P)H) small subunit [Janthinobacterium psychrotolerans]OBV37609.1 nitrite reductase (NADH) small subunit [Janthinobacterium psychrotolerans]